MRIAPVRPRPWRRLALASLALHCLGGTPPAPVCVRVGPSSLDAEQIGARLAALPAFRRAALAARPEELVVRFTDEVLVPELLLAAEAQRRQLTSSPAGAAATREVLRAALVSALRAEIAQHEPITDAEIVARYEAERARFHRPLRIRIWRILVEDELAAREILAAARGVNGPSRWSELARTRSRDPATAMRKGDLGFVHPDGKTDVPTVRVDPALYAAVAPLRDGELCPEILREGSRFAVVWRRGSLAAEQRSLAEATPSLRAALEQERLTLKLSRLIAALERRHVVRGAPELLERLGELPITPPELLPPPILSAARPHVAPTPPARSAAPTPTDLGLR